MQGPSSVRSVQFSEERDFNGVKVFSATMVQDRERLGDRVTAWMRKNPSIEVREIYVTQSSDQAFHCLAFTVFFWEDV